MNSTIVSICGASDALKETVRGFLPAGFALRELRSVLELHRSGELERTSVLILPEALPEGPGLKVIELIRRHIPQPPRLWFFCVDDDLRKQAFDAGADDYFSLPLGNEFKTKLQVFVSEPQPDLAGNLKAFTPFLLIQFLNSARSSGVVAIHGSAEFRLTFNDGELIDAVAGEKHGEAALLELLQARTDELTFEFDAAASTVIPRTIMQRTDHLLLSLASALDEAA